MTLSPDTAARSRWMSILAKSRWSDLERNWASEAPGPAFTHLRPPETGLVMVRGRMGGTGGPFNMGEMTVTRCAVRLENHGAGRAPIAGHVPIVGHAYVMGRNMRHAEVAALFDALLQDEDSHARVMDGVIEPLAARVDAGRAAVSAEAAATKVDFFTLVRGED